MLLLTGRLYLSSSEMIRYECPLFERIRSGAKYSRHRQPRPGHRGTWPAAGWWPLAVIASAHLMAVLDTTVMFVALPSVQHALGMTARPASGW